MVLAVARKCTRHLCLIVGIVALFAMVIYIFPSNNGRQTSTHDLAVLQPNLPQLRILSFKNSLTGIRTEAPPQDHHIQNLDLYNHGVDGDDPGNGRDGDEAVGIRGNTEKPYSDVIQDGGKGDGGQASVPKMRDRDLRTDFLDREQIRLNTEDIILKEESPHRKTVTKVVILTYMRSGSTLTGDLFQHHPDVFYVFEPLWKLQKIYNDHYQVVSYLNRNAIRDTFPHDEFWTPSSMSTQTLENMLSCNMADLDIETLRAAHLTTSVSTRKYARCLVYHPKKKSVEAIADCFPLLQSPCSKANVTVVKTIRYTVEQLQHLLSSDPDVKVIHLFRDPRGTLYSQSRVGEFKWKNREPAFAKLCIRVAKDLKNLHMISKMFPKRVLMVRYEDIVQYPVASAKFMYDFVGLKMLDTIKDYIWNITYAGTTNKKCKSLCTMRANSTNTAYKWRRVLGYADIQMIDTYCSGVYRVLGYRHFTNRSQYSDPQYSSRFDDFGLNKAYVKLMTVKELEAMPESNFQKRIPESQNNNHLLSQGNSNFKLSSGLERNHNIYFKKPPESQNLNFQKELEANEQENH